MKIKKDWLILLFFSVLFVASSIWLFFAGNKGLDSDLSNDWWAVYFIDAKGEKADFTIENHSRDRNFQWTVSVDKNVIAENASTLKTGESKTIEIAQPNAAQKITVKIISENKTKEIYKNFN